MKPIRAAWTGAILVCGKCSKRAGGFGPKRRPLVKALRRALGMGKGRKASLGVVATRCLGVCPKRGVTLIDTRRPAEWRVVEAGADLDMLVASLDVGSHPDDLDRSSQRTLGSQAA